VHLIMVSALAGLFMALCVWTAHTHAPRIEAELDRRVQEIVAPIPTLTQTVDGRDVRLIGRVPTRVKSDAMREAVDSLVRSIAALDGVRTVRADLRIAPPPTPLTAAAFRDADPGDS